MRILIEKPMGILGSVDGVHDLFWKKCRPPKKRIPAWLADTVNTAERRPLLRTATVGHAPTDPYKEREVGHLSVYAWEVFVFVPSTATH